MSNEATSRVATVEEFKLRIAAIIRAKPEQIPAAPRPLKQAANRKAKLYESKLAAKPIQRFVGLIRTALQNHSAVSPLRFPQ